MLFASLVKETPIPLPASTLGKLVLILFNALFMSLPVTNPSEFPITPGVTLIPTIPLFKVRPIPFFALVFTSTTPSAGPIFIHSSPSQAYNELPGAFAAPTVQTSP